MSRGFDSRAATDVLRISGWDNQRRARAMFMLCTLNCTRPIFIYFCCSVCTLYTIRLRKPLGADGKRDRASAVRFAKRRREREREAKEATKSAANTLLTQRDYLKR